MNFVFERGVVGRVLRLDPNIKKKIMDPCPEVVLWYGLHGHTEGVEICANQCPALVAMHRLEFLACRFTNLGKRSTSQYQ